MQHSKNVEPGEGAAETAKNVDEEVPAAKKAAMHAKIRQGEFEHELSEEDPRNAKQEAACSKHGWLSCSPWPESEAKKEAKKI